MSNTWCHQCKMRKPRVTCCDNFFSAHRGTRCNGRFCDGCIVRHYGEDPEAFAELTNWVCYRCTGRCTCAACKRKRKNVGGDVDGVNGAGIVPEDDDDDPVRNFTPRVVDMRVPPPSVAAPSSAGVLPPPTLTFQPRLSRSSSGAQLDVKKEDEVLHRPLKQSSGEKLLSDLQNACRSSDLETAPVLVAQRKAAAAVEQMPACSLDASSTAEPSFHALAQLAEQTLHSDNVSSMERRLSAHETELGRLRAMVEQMRHEHNMMLSIFVSTMQSASNAPAAGNSSAAVQQKTTPTIANNSSSTPSSTSMVMVTAGNTF